MLELQELTKHYRGIPAIENIDLQVKRGEIVGFLGPNGAGKSAYVYSLEVLSAAPEEDLQKRTQFSMLVHHFLQRFFNHETASSEGDAKTGHTQVWPESPRSAS